MSNEALSFTKAAIRRAADSGSYQRGEEYFRDGSVYSLLEDEAEIVAKVHGTHDYKVRLWAKGGEVHGTCSCPRGDFCKHLVAVGLAYLAGGVPQMPSDGGTPKSGRRPKRLPKPKVTLKDIREYLLAQDPAGLVEIIIQQVKEDDRLRESLLMKVACGLAGGADLATFKAAIDSATEPGDFVDYRESWDFVGGIDSVVDSIADLLRGGQAAEVIELTEHALRRCESAMGQMDDSDGEITDAMERIQDLHHAACRKAKPDPKALARKLFQWEIQGDWDTFHGGALTYADVLGKAGLGVYRRLAQELWDQIPQLGPGEEGRFAGTRWQITSIMESLAKASGDVEQLVAVLARDLSSPVCYLRIAQAYKNARLADKALQWAEKGLAAFPGEGAEWELESFLADEYHHRRRHDDAMRLVWNQFRRGMRLDSYKRLKSHADRAKQWPAWRPRALAEIRAEVEREKRQRKGEPAGLSWEWGSPGDHSLLVEVLLWEQDAGAAWREAQAGGCNNALWMRLAAAREKDHPADALAVYQRQIDPLANRKNNDAYHEAAKLIREIRKLMAQLGQEDEFPRYLAAVRQAHKPKRNFMAMLSKL